MGEGYSEGYHPAPENPSLFYQSFLDSNGVSTTCMSPTRINHARPWQRSDDDDTVVTSSVGGPHEDVLRCSAGELERRHLLLARRTSAN